MGPKNFRGLQNMKLKKMLLVSIVLFGLLPFFGHTVHGQGFNEHVVQRGESMWKISVKYQVGLSEIINANKEVKNPAMIYPNQKLKIPNIDNVKNVENEVLAIVNKERAANGLQPLQMDWELARVARTKSQDMATKNYFSHQSPTYGSPFDMMKQFGINYKTAGENIASGQTTPSAVMVSWMNSQGHRANILKSDYTHLGVGYYRGGSYGHMWTQMFISK
jgi:uncharacterized YkwD family protein/spore coat assembly protein SafA